VDEPRTSIVRRAQRSEPFLTGVCGSGDHRLCGGWWCVCECHDDTVIDATSYALHVDHEPWEQVGACVYCGCGERLYHGTLPADRDGRAAIAAFRDTVSAQAAADWKVARAAVLAARGVVR
jgi:hypothetical protein